MKTIKTPYDFRKHRKEFDKEMNEVRENIWKGLNDIRDGKITVKESQAINRDCGKRLKEIRKKYLNKN